jgi:hypothetical protein
MVCDTGRRQEEFDFSAEPPLDPQQVCASAICRWVVHRDALLMSAHSTSA